MSTSHLVSFTAGLAFGYDTIINAASLSMPVSSPLYLCNMVVINKLAFFLYFGDFGPSGPYLPSIWTCLWTAMSALLQCIGAYSIGFVLDRYGRKWPTVAASCVTVTGTAIQFTATTRGALLAGKILNGPGIGAAMAAATTYASEVAPLRLRSPVQSGLVLFTVLSQGVTLGIIRTFVPNDAESAFRIVFAIQWVVAGLLILAFAVTPESPVYLMNSSHLALAKKSMALIYGPNNDVEARLAHLIKTIREEDNRNNQLERATCMECFQGTDLKRTLTVCFLYATANLGGAAFLAQSIYFLIIAGLPPIHAFDVSIGGFGLACIIIVCTWFMGDKVKQQSQATNRCLGWPSYQWNIHVGSWCAVSRSMPHPAALCGLLLFSYISLQIATLQGMGWPIAAELSSYRLRSKTISVGVVAQTFTTWLTSFVMPYIYNFDAGNLGARAGFVFAGTRILLFLVAYLFVPDTTGLTAEEIDAAYRERIPARGFQKGVLRIVDGRGRWMFEWLLTSRKGLRRCNEEIVSKIPRIPKLTSPVDNMRYFAPLLPCDN